MFDPILSCSHFSPGTILSKKTNKTNSVENHGKLPKHNDFQECCFLFWTKICTLGGSFRHSAIPAAIGKSILSGAPKSGSSTKKVGKYMNLEWWGMTAFRKTILIRNLMQSHNKTYVPCSFKNFQFQQLWFRWYTLPETNIFAPEKWIVGVRISFWDGLFSGANC